MTEVPSNNQKLIDNIQNLQNMEKQLYSNLEDLPKNNNGANQQNQIIEKINMMSDSRVHLYENLLATYGLIKDNVSSETQDVKDKIALLQSHEQQLNDMKNHVNHRKMLNVNNLRLTEINTYYSQKYKAYFGIFKKIALLCIILIVVSVLRQRYLITPRIANILAIILILICGFLTVPSVFDLSARNNLVFDEYDFGLNPTVKHNGTTLSSMGSDFKNRIELGLEDLDANTKKYAEDLKLIAEGDCVGPHCCTASGLKYDDTTNTCVVEQFTNRPPLGYSVLNDPPTQLVGSQNPGLYSIN